MRTRVLVAMLLPTLSASAQEPKSPAAAPELPRITVPQPAPAFTGAVQSPCSIPLIPMQIPKDIDFKLRQVQPNKQSMAPMPEGKPPAPPCNQPLPISRPAK